MKTEYKHVHFEVNEWSQGMWSCMQNGRDDRLCLIDFYKPWKTYVVVDFEDALFSAEYLRDIADFLEQLNEAEG